MAIEIFWGSGSPYSWRVLLALELKQVAYESHLLSFSKGEHRAPEFLAVNPRGRVPALRDGDLVLYESLAILAYLDRRFPDPPLFGATTEQTGHVWQGISEYQSYVDTAVEDYILTIYEGELPQKLALVRAATATLRRELPHFEALAARRPWLAGDGVTALDLVVYPALASIRRASEKPIALAHGVALHPLDAAWPHLAAWMTRVESLPGFDRTVPPHWRARG